MSSLGRKQLLQLSQQAPLYHWRGCSIQAKSYSCCPGVFLCGPARLQHHKEQGERWIPLGEGAEIPLESLRIVSRHTGVLTRG